MASPTTWAKRTGGALCLFVLIGACCIVALTLLVRLFSPVYSSGGTVGAAVSPRGAIPTLRVAGPTAPGRGRGPAESGVPIVSAPDVGLLSVAPNSPQESPPGPSVGAPPDGPNEPPPTAQPPGPSPSNPPPSPEPPPPEEPVVALADSSVASGHMSLATTGDAGSAVISLVIGDDPDEACPPGSSDLRIGIGSSDESVAIVTPSIVSYSCTGTQTVTIHPVGPGTATIELEAPASEPGTEFDLGGATFEVLVSREAPSNTAPELTTPDDLTAQADHGSAIVTWDASATDLEDGSLTPLCTPPSGSSFGMGTPW